MTTSFGFSITDLQFSMDFQLPIIDVAANRKSLIANPLPIAHCQLRIPVRKVAN